ncbi:MAG: spermidine synthase [Halieaceae bacterium]|jgi:spermidine synthase
MPASGEAVELSRLLFLSVPEHELLLVDGRLRIYEAQGYRWLTTGNAVQTAMRLERPYELCLANHRAMTLAVLLAGGGGDCTAVLDLGAGGGGFLRHCRHFLPAAELVAVERDPLMIEIAREYFALPATQSIHLESADQFLRRDQYCYDLVLCDLFDGREAPAFLDGAGFFPALQDRLNPGGAIALNTLPSSEEQLLSILRAARAVFQGIALLQFTDLGNIVLIMQREAIPDAATLADRLAGSVYARDPWLESTLAAVHRID